MRLIVINKFYFFFKPSSSTNDVSQRLHRSGSNQDSNNRNSIDDADNQNKFNSSLYTLPIIKPPLAQAESDSLLSLNISNRSSLSPQLPQTQAPPIASRPEKTKSIVSILAITSP